MIINRNYSSQLQYNSWLLLFTEQFTYVLSHSVNGWRFFNRRSPAAYLNCLIRSWYSFIELSIPIVSFWNVENQLPKILWWNPFLITPVSFLTPRFKNETGGYFDFIKRTTIPWCIFEFMKNSLFRAGKWNGYVKIEWIYIHWAGQVK